MLIKRFSHIFLLCAIVFAICAADSIVFKRKSKQPKWKLPTYREYDASEIIGKSPEDIIGLRGFGSETHYARTRDGYHIHVVRMINPKFRNAVLKRPVVFNHGLLESSTIWLINSYGVKPSAYSRGCSPIEMEHSRENTTRFLNGPMMLSNSGYDVWLMSMRGTDWSLRHDYLSPEDEAFWNYSLDDFGLTDIPAVIEYIRSYTGSAKVGYIGHSQATFSIFALLSSQPRYADVIEPVVAVAPVAYFDHVTSIGLKLFLGFEDLTISNGPFPPAANKLRKFFGDICRSKGTKGETSACQLIDILVSGNGQKWPRGYYSHIPFYTSAKVLRHFGQLAKNKRFARYDYGQSKNLQLYGQRQSLNYPVERIRSRSLCLFSTQSDILAPPEDVKHFKSRLSVPLYRDVFIIGEYNHFDLITHQDSRKMVFAPILEVFESFERANGVCAASNDEDSEF